MRVGENTREVGDNTDFLYLHPRVTACSWGLALLGGSTLPVNVDLHEGEGNGEASLREALWESEDHFCFPQGSCVEDSRTVAGGPRVEAEGRGRRGSDTSPGHLPAAPPSWLAWAPLLSELFLLPSGLPILGLSGWRWESWENGRQVVNLQSSVQHNSFSGEELLCSVWLL